MRPFTAQETTTQPPSVIWAIWSDVENWPDWDKELQFSQLDGDFREGATGTLKAKGSPVSQFVITECIIGERFKYEVILPFTRLEVDHYFIAGEQTTFVHEVAFTGMLGWLFRRLLGTTYQQGLPIALSHIKDIAESERKAPR